MMSTTVQAVRELAGQGTFSYPTVSVRCCVVHAAT